MNKYNLWSSSYQKNDGVISAIKEKIQCIFSSLPLYRRVQEYYKSVFLHNFKQYVTLFIIALVITLIILLLIKISGISAVESGSMRNFINGGLV